MNKDELKELVNRMKERREAYLNVSRQSGSETTRTAATSRYNEVQAVLRDIAELAGEDAVL